MDDLKPVAFSQSSLPWLVAERKDEEAHSYLCSLDFYTYYTYLHNVHLQTLTTYMPLQAEWIGTDMKIHIFFIAESFLQVSYTKSHGIDVCILSNKLLHVNKVI